MSREGSEPRYSRPRAGLWLRAGLLITWVAALGFASSVPEWLAPPPSTIDQPAAHNYHLPSSAITSTRRFVPRGTSLADDDLLAAVRRSDNTRTNHAGALLLALLTGAAFLLHLHHVDGRLGRRRDHVALFGWLVAATMASAGFLWFAPLSPAWLPTTAFVVAVARQLGRRTAVGFALVLAVAAGTLLYPFDPTVTAAAAGSGLAAALVLTQPGPPRRGALAIAAIAVAASGALAYAAIQWAQHGQLDPADLASLEHGRLLGAALAGIVWTPVGLGLEHGLARLLGNLSRTALLALSDLGHPLLQRIATRAPGTWAHSRMMANLAESAAQRIGADALLVRVGAYYHDLGKADAPQYFVENNVRGQTNPHDELDPHTSARHIIEHVRASVRRGRQAGLPEDILAFMHTHHGDGRPEYFYQKARRLADDPDQVDPLAFRYPGERPQDRENGILAIVDTVEAAARTLHHPSREDIEDLVHRLIMGKLRGGQLDDTGLTPADLRLIAEDLVRSLVATAHDRIAYPWQERRTGAWNAAEQSPANVALSPADAREPEAR